ncbi:hypothetical protein [Elstera litoralis]|uniref:hypothetical protein n=1 Tax=Elstera litoralis TaxID=552518 RepID=UPI001E4F209C|nr:hypothetical protein [Elstera litoralis]
MQKILSACLVSALALFAGAGYAADKEVAVIVKTVNSTFLAECAKRRDRCQ